MQEPIIPCKGRRSQCNRRNSRNSHRRNNSRNNLNHHSHLLQED